MAFDAAEVTVVLIIHGICTHALHARKGALPPDSCTHHTHPHPSASHRWAFQDAPCLLAHVLFINEPNLESRSSLPEVIFTTTLVKAEGIILHADE